MTAQLTQRLNALFVDWLIIVTYALCLQGASSLFHIAFLKGFPQMNEGQGNLISFFILLLPVYLFWSFLNPNRNMLRSQKRKQK